MRRIRTSIPWVYRALSVAVIVVGMIVLINDSRFFSFDFISAYIVISVMIIDLALLCIITLASTVRKGGLRSILPLLRSTRFRLTLWYTAILVLILFMFGSIVIATEKYDLNISLAANLHTLLKQVASMYKAQAGLPSSLFDNNGSQRRFSDYEIVLLMTPQGRVLQTPGLPGDITSMLVKDTTGNFLQWQASLSPDQKPGSAGGTQDPLGPAGSNMQAYDLETVGFYDVKGITYGFARAVIINQQQQVVALLAVGIPSNVSYQLQNLLSIFEIATPLVILLSLVGGYWLAGWAMRPVQAITRTAQQISETDLHRRLNLKQRDELGELAATFDRMLERLEAAFQRQRQFTADASHELRTPLSIVDLEADRALAHPRTTGEYQQAITIIQQENRHMTRLVNDLLVLARADNGQFRLKYELVDLSEIVVDSVERLAPLAQQTGITIRMARLPELFLPGDRTYLVQLLTDIVENALKYSAGVGTHVDIDLVQEQRQGQDWAKLRILDDGPGIAEEHLPHLFERFYRVDRSRTHSQELVPGAVSNNGLSAGSGLGLSIARWIAQAHGGDIQVQSIVGLGAVFTIWLPLPGNKPTCE
jgi:two-component system OmpR family sensor kinase